MRLLFVGLTLSALAMAQHGRAVRAGGGPQVQATRQPRVETKAAKGAGPSAQVKGTPQRMDVVTHLEKHPQMATRLQALLPEGMTPDVAAAGFKNTGQFIAALHVSQNLGIPFEDLKLQMTGENPVSLGKAIQALKPELPEGDVQEAVRTAERQRKMDESAVRDQERIQKRDRDQQQQPTTTP